MENVEVLRNMVWLYEFDYCNATINIYRGKIVKETFHDEIGLITYFMTDHGTHNGWYVRVDEPDVVVNGAYMWCAIRSDEYAKETFLEELKKYVEAANVKVNEWIAESRRRNDLICKFASRNHMHEVFEFPDDK